MNKQIINLYDHYKNTPKKLKIVCDWDEVIQACEPYALSKTIELPEFLSKMKFKTVEGRILESSGGFPGLFKDFWKLKIVEYSPHGSRLIKNDTFLKQKRVEKQIQIKNSSNFYQEAPFLTIAEDLMKLIKIGIAKPYSKRVKTNNGETLYCGEQGWPLVEKIIFLSVYNKRKFPDGDPRKKEIFKQTFGKFSQCSLQLIDFDSETQGQSKADWIKENASDFDIVIDDNPNICKSLMELNKSEQEISKEEITELLEKETCNFCFKKAKREELAGFKTKNSSSLDIEKPICFRCWKDRQISIENNAQYYYDLDHYYEWKIDVISPYYPAIENQHDERVLLVKNEVSELKEGDFK